MIDYKRLLLNLAFFFLGILIPLLSFQSAFAETWSNVGSSFYAFKNWYVETYGSIVTMAATDPALTLRTKHTSSQGDLSTADTFITGSGSAKTYQLFDVGNNYNNTMDLLQWKYSSDYVPPVLEPETCSNTVMDGDETGVNCGGSCLASCVESCPSGTEELTGLDGQPGCFWTALADKYGNCPSGTVSGSTIGIDGTCYKEYDYFKAADSVPVPTVSGPSMTKGTFSVTHFVGGETVVDNGDGTETATINHSSTDSDGKTKNGSTSVNRPSGSPTGTGFSDGNGDDPLGIAPGYSGQSQTDENGDPEDNPENYDYQLEKGEYDGELSDDDIPDKESLTDLVQGFMSDNPVVSTITGSGIDLDSPVSQLSWVYPPTGTEVIFDLSDRGGVLASIGFLLVFLSGISAYYIIVGRQ